MPIGPDKYSNLKSDLITKNKIDAVSFEFADIEKRSEEVYAYSLKVYGKELEFNEEEIRILEEDLNESFAAETTYGDLLQTREIKDKRFHRRT